VNMGLEGNFREYGASESGGWFWGNMEDEENGNGNRQMRREQGYGGGSGVGG